MKITNRFLKWDPSWGWENRIYYLGSWKNDGPFYMSNSALYADDGRLYYVPSRGRLAAGSFDDAYYYGSVSHDFFIGRDRTAIDQELIVLDRNWREISSWRPSLELTRNNKYISNTIQSSHPAVAFRDPAVMPDGNIAVCTGGHRWNTFGNVCAVKFINNKLSLARETILDPSMLSFKEIERVTFWEDWMFFSVNGGSSVYDRKSRFIHVAKAKASGQYAYHSIVNNSWMCYGPDVSKDLRALYWIKGVFRINSPKGQNLHYCNGSWRLSGRDAQHLFYTTLAAKPLLEKGIRNVVKSTKNILAKVNHLRIF